MKILNNFWKVEWYVILGIYEKAFISSFSDHVKLLIDFYREFVISSLITRQKQQDAKEMYFIHHIQAINAYPPYIHVQVKCNSIGEAEALK